MSMPIHEALRRARIEKGLSQQQLAEAMNVDRSTVTKWETGDRLPNAATLARLSSVLGFNLAELLGASDEKPRVMLVDDSRVILNDGLAALKEALPNASVTGFIWPKKAIEYAKANPVALAVLDIELGAVSGLDLCHTLLEINPHTNVVYLTAYPDYALDAWNTEACGFMVKPLTPESIRSALVKLRYPLLMGGKDE